MRYKKHLLRVCCILLTLVLCMVGCEKEKDNKNSVNEDEFLPVMADVSNTKKTNNKGNGGKKVALTFDDGPHNVYTKAIVDELSKYGYNATFFVLGNRVDGTDYNGSSALIYAAEKGNEIGIHGYTHEIYYDRCSDADYNNEISKTDSAIKNRLKGTNPKLMRPIGGKITDSRIQTAKYSVIFWDVDSEDWRYKYKPSDDEATKKEKLDTIVNNVMSSVREGSIILMHDIYEGTYDATVIILQRLHQEGYEVVTVSELLGSDLSAGKSYSRRAAS